MIGGSRGGLEMFLALARYPELQNKIDKVVSLSSILDLRQWIQERPDMKQAFQEEFGLMPGINEEEWINQRNPLTVVKHIQTCLPILIVQGTHDNRVSLNEGRKMVEALKKHGNHVTYWEIPGGQHTLENIPNRMDRVMGWLELSEE
jgi:dipeptidyl aminopeptidase/acylaminoacyl peptidase